MQVYKIPYNFKHEEKVFGGYVSIRQAIYLIIAASSVVVFFIPLVNIFIKAMVFLSLASMFLAFAFLKVEETYADKYFIYILSFLFRSRKYILEKGKELC